jgi:AcrR family transcriptional regulator
MPRKPRQSRSISTVEAIVDAGFLCLARHGPMGTTTNHIAEMAGLSTGSLYEYFANKEEIYAAMGERFLGDITAVVQALAPQLAQMDVGDVIRALAKGLSELLIRDDNRYLHFTRYILLADSREFAESISKLLMDLTVQYLMNHPRYMRLRHLQTMVYIVINAGIYNVMRHLSSDNPPVSFDELIEGFVRMVTYYVAYDLQTQQ